jgi:hypothetical protein
VVPNEDHGIGFGTALFLIKLLFISNFNGLSFIDSLIHRVIPKNCGQFKDKIESLSFQPLHVFHAFLMFNVEDNRAEDVGFIVMLNILYYGEQSHGIAAQQLMPAIAATV